LTPPSAPELHRTAAATGFNGTASTSIRLPGSGSVGASLRESFVVGSSDPRRRFVGALPNRCSGSVRRNRLRAGATEDEAIQEEHGFL
jgi:hypothetical protein